MDHVAMTEEEKKELDDWAQRQPVQGPSPIYFVKPVYPEAMREARRQGRVRITATVAPEGVLTDISITGDAAFIPATSEAANNWQFVPARVQGTPVPVPFTLDLAFSVSTDQPGPLPAPLPLGVEFARPAR
jgi:TonB family protein